MIALYAASALAGERFALISSASSGGPDRVTLRHTEADADRIEGVLLAVGGLQAERLVRLTDPSADEVRQALLRLSRELPQEEEAELILYFTGHADDSGLLFGSQRLPYAELRDTIDAMRASLRVVVIDGCSSGAILREKGGTHEAPLLVEPRLEGVAYLTSSARGEVSQESDQLGGSFFTHSLAAGLRGAADASNDGRVTLAEAYRYAYQSTLALTERTLGGAQHASFDLTLAGAGDAVLTRLEQESGRLGVSSALQGSVTVRQPGGAVVAELAPSRDRDAMLAVAPGTYELLVRDASGLRGVTVAVGDEPRWVEADELVPLDEPAAQRKGKKVPVRTLLAGVAVTSLVGAGVSWTVYTSADPLTDELDKPLHAFYFATALGVMSTTAWAVMPGDSL